MIHEARHDMINFGVQGSHEGFKVTRGQRWIWEALQRQYHSSSVVTLSRPPTVSCLQITDCSFRYASRCPWNHLRASLHQPHQSCLMRFTSSSICHPISLIIPALIIRYSFTPRSIPTFSTNPSHLQTSVTYWTVFMIMVLDRTCHTHQFIFSFTF